MSTFEENNRKAQEEATARRTALKKKWNRFAMVPLVLALIFFIFAYFFR